MDARGRQKVSDTLIKIEGAAGWLNHYAKDLQGRIQMLEARPAWQTLARDFLSDAEKELMIALATVRAARDIYDNLPVIVEEYHQAAE